MDSKGECERVIQMEETKVWRRTHETFSDVTVVEDSRGKQLLKQAKNEVCH